MSDDTPPEWLESLPEPLRNAPFIGKAESVDDAVGKLAHAAKLVGSSVRIPGSDASDEDRRKFYDKLKEVDGVSILPTHDDIDGVMTLLGKLGYPEEHTGYELPKKDGFEWDERMGEDLRKYAHQAGLTPGQFTALSQQIMQQEIDADLAAGTAAEDARKALRADWGDTLEEREALIRGYLEHSEAPESMRQLLDNRELPLDSMNWLHSIAKQFKGDVAPISKDGKTPTPALTPAEIETKLLKVRQDLFGMAEIDPRYNDLKQQMVTLHKQLASARSAA